MLEVSTTLSLRLLLLPASDEKGQPQAQRGVGGEDLNALESRREMEKNFRIATMGVLEVAHRKLRALPAAASSLAPTQYAHRRSQPAEGATKRATPASEARGAVGVREPACAGLPTALGVLAAKLVSIDRINKETSGPKG